MVTLNGMVTQHSAMIEYTGDGGVKKVDGGVKTDPNPKSSQGGQAGRVVSICWAYAQRNSEMGLVGISLINLSYF
jgi:hypothetical protein